jgi:hypothetical protein
LTVIFPFAVAVGHLTWLIRFKEQYLRDALICIDLGRQRRRVANFQRDVAFPLRFKGGDIGDDARVGSNSVVLKPVPAGVTVVGIPAHIIGEQKALKPKPIANNQPVNFNAYGASADMPDPVASAINLMLDHIEALDKQIDTMQKAMNEAGIQYQKNPPPCKLEGCEIKDVYRPIVP